MECIKTGCNAYLEGYCTYVHGDLFQTASGQLLMRVSAVQPAPKHWGTLHLDRVRVEHWFDRNSPHVGASTLLIASSGELCYEGMPL